MKKTQLPKYDPDQPWAHLWSIALTREQARTVRNTLAVTDPYQQNERACLASCCQRLGDDHFLVADRHKTISVWRTNPPAQIKGDY